MSAIHLPWAALMLMSVSPLSFGGEANAQEPITAVYKTQEVSFQYRSTSHFYSCHELEQRVAVILVAVGARDDINVNVRNCDAYVMPEDSPMDMESPFGRGGMDDNRDRWGSSTGFRHPGSDREQSASVRVRLMMPVEVTPEVLAEIDKDKSRRELVSRVTGNPAAALNDAIAFAAQRQEVTVTDRSRRLRAEDCELLEQMTTHVLRKLDVRVIRKSFSCGPRVSSRIPPQLVVEALLPTGALRPLPEPESKRP